MVKRNNLIEPTSEKIKKIDLPSKRIYKSNHKKKFEKIIKIKMSPSELTAYSCKNCYLEFYYENRVTHCPFCGNKLKYVGEVQENEIEEPIYTKILHWRKNAKEDRRIRSN